MWCLLWSDNLQRKWNKDPPKSKASPLRLKNLKNTPIFVLDRSEDGPWCTDYTPKNWNSIDLLNQIQMKLALFNEKNEEKNQEKAVKSV